MLRSALLLLTSALASLILAGFSLVFGDIDDGACHDCLQDFYFPCAAENEYSDALKGDFSNCVCGARSQTIGTICLNSECNTIVYFEHTTWCLNSNTAFQKQLCTLPKEGLDFFLKHVGPSFKTTC